MLINELANGFYHKYSVSQMQGDPGPPGPDLPAVQVSGTHSYKKKLAVTQL